MCIRDSYTLVLLVSLPTPLFTLSFTPLFTAGKGVVDEVNHVATGEIVETA